MDISYNELKNKEVINLNDGKKLGHVIDIVFDSESGKVEGVVVPGEKKLFRKNDEIFIPLEKIRKLGDDVMLVRIDAFHLENQYFNSNSNNQKYYGDGKQKNNSFIRYKRVDNKKYK